MVRHDRSRSAEDIIAIGQDLLAAKEQLLHGQFGEWLTAEFDMTQMTAVRFMQVAQRFGDKSNKLLDFNPSILYALAAPTAEDVADEVIERVTSGEVAPTVAEVKHAIAEAMAAKALV